MTMSPRQGTPRWHANRQKMGGRRLGTDRPPKPQEGTGPVGTPILALWPQDQEIRGVYCGSRPPCHASSQQPPDTKSPRPTPTLKERTAPVVSTADQVAAPGTPCSGGCVLRTAAWGAVASPPGPGTPAPGAGFSLAGAQDTPARAATPVPDAWWPEPVRSAASPAVPALQSCGRARALSPQGPPTSLTGSL